MTDHFRQDVPQATRDKLNLIADEVQEALISELGEPLGCVNRNEISGNSYDGFIAFQKGGFEVSELIRFDQDASYHIDDEMAREADALYEGMLQDAATDFDFDVTEYDNMTEEQRERLFDYECEYFEPALLRFEIWVDDNDRITARLSLNTRDAPYYRASRDRTLIAHDTTQARLLKLDVAEFVQRFNI